MPSGVVVQRAISPELDKIESLLSYGIFDWVITDAEAIEALQILKTLPTSGVLLQRKVCEPVA